MKLKLLIVLIVIFLLCSLCSCTSTQPISTQSASFPKYSLLERIDPNTVSSEYLIRITNYDRILDSSPIPVFIISIEEFTSKIFLKIKTPRPMFKISDINILGMYFHGKVVDDLPEEFFFINSALTPEQIMVTYFHELGHYYHLKNKCKGCFADPIIRETHAIYNELKMGWQHELPHVLESAIRTMGIYAVRKDADMIYKMATFAVMETDLWKETMAYLITLEKGITP